MIGVEADRPRRSYVKYGFLHPADRERVINGIVAKIRRDGMFEDKEPAAINLHLAAARNTCLWDEAHTPNCEPGAAYFDENEAASFVSLIITDAYTAQHSKQYLRMFSHELAEHLQTDWVAPALFDAEEVVITSPVIDTQRERHSIAREVERRLYGSSHN